MNHSTKTRSEFIWTWTEVSEIVPAQMVHSKTGKLWLILDVSCIQLKSACRVNEITCHVPKRIDVMSAVRPMAFETAGR